MVNKIFLKNVENKIQIFNENPDKDFSVHLWRIDDLNKKNKERLYISGWTNEILIEKEVQLPGTYYAQIYFRDGSTTKSNSIVVNDDIFSLMPSTYVTDMRQTFEKQAQLMQKMYVTGTDYIVQKLKVLLEDKTLNVFAEDISNMRIGNMIFASEFFNHELHINHLIGNDRTNIGYQISMSFRTQYEILDPFVAKITKQDALLVVDADGVSEQVQEQLEIAKNNGATILYLSQVVAQAFNDRYIVQPLVDAASQGATVVAVKFPRAADVINKSAHEEVASKTTIAKIRADLRKGIYPDILSNLNVDETYMTEVLAGWKVVPHEGGFDTLQDKSGKYVNIVNGHRVIPIMDEVTEKQSELETPENRNLGKVQFFGNSVMYGIGSDDENTLPSLIAEKYISEGKQYKFENLANFSMNDYVRAGNLMNSMKFTEHDIVIFGSHLNFEPDQIKAIGGYYINLQPTFDRPHDSGEVFIDMTHMNRNGYKNAAEKVYEYLSDNNIL